MQLQRLNKSILVIVFDSLFLTELTVVIVLSVLTVWSADQRQQHSLDASADWAADENRAKAPADAALMVVAVALAIVDPCKYCGKRLHSFHRAL